MNKKNITPNSQQPVDRVPTGKLPSALAELSEEALSGSVTPAGIGIGGFGGFGSFSCLSSGIGSANCFCSACSYEGDDAE